MFGEFDRYVLLATFDCEFVHTCANTALVAIEHHDQHL